MNKNNSRFRQANPKISVVIPAYNESSSIRQCLESLKTQSFNLPFEVIIVDGPSTDKTYQIANKNGAITFKLNRRGIGIGWQYGVEKAKSEIIAFTEADTIVPSNWLEFVYENFRKNPEMVALVGRYKFKNKTILNHLVLPVMFFIDKVHYFWQGHYALRGTNFAVRKKLLIKCGGFDMDIKTHGDVELSSRIKKHGRINYFPELIVKTSNRNFKSLGNFIHFLIRGFKAVYYIEVIGKPKLLSKMYDIR